MNKKINQYLMIAAAAVACVMMGCSSSVKNYQEEVTHNQVEAPKGYTMLFNEKNFDGWCGEDRDVPRKEARKPGQSRRLNEVREHWRVEDGHLVNDGEGLYLTTEKEYGDFELFLQYKLSKGADSGIYLRGCPQIQIWDTTEKSFWKFGANEGSGGLWNNGKFHPGQKPLINADKPIGEWNKMRIVMVGSHVTVWLNGVRIVDHAILENAWDRKALIPMKGPIQLQTHDGEVAWGNIYAREIGTDEANEILRNGGPEKALDKKGFVNAFNGNNFNGWSGPTENYQIVEGGVLMCKPHKGGTIYTNEVYKDFGVKLDIKIPAGGNNGLAIRYPGQGDSAYVGMCELQVLDNTAEKYKNLKPGQYHGSAYCMAPAKRGYQRPIGEWNYQEVHVTGSNIKVELNGFVILDVDTAKLDPQTFHYYAAKFKGRKRTEGHFGFCGHHDPVQFRNIEIKKY